MKHLTLTIALLIVIGVPALVSIAGEPLVFKNFNGPTEIRFGPVYTYSVTVEGDFEELGWSATGGNVLKEWRDDRQYFCEVQWYENIPEDPAKLKVWGEDDYGKIQAEQLYVSIRASRSLGGYRSLRSAGGKCLDLHIHDLEKNGGRVQLWECNNKIQQKWRFDNQGRLVNAGGRCLDVHIPDLKKDGGKVQVWECNDEPQQKWKLDAKGRVVSGGGKCLDVDVPDLKKDGGKVQIWECNDEPQQQWKLE